MTTNDIASVLLPIIRRVMPTLIANDIIGVAPMTGPVSNIFDIHSAWANRSQVMMTKVHYGHFLRVHNRRQYHLADYITDLGYQKMRVSRRADLHLDAAQWCKDNLKAGSYVRRFGDFWFAYNSDYTMFKLRWAND